MKYINFTKTFLKGHPKHGQPTYFILKILNSINAQKFGDNSYRLRTWYLNELQNLNKKNIELGKINLKHLVQFIDEINADHDKIIESYPKLGEHVVTRKHTTIRHNTNLKVGELFSPRTWLKQPYKSPQLIFWQPLGVANIDSFEILGNDVWRLNKRPLSLEAKKSIAAADGLTLREMEDWFTKPVKAQRISF